MDVEQEAGTEEFGGDLRRRLLMNHSVGCIKAGIGSQISRIWTRGLYVVLSDTVNAEEETRMRCDLRPKGS